MRTNQIVIFIQILMAVSFTAGGRWAIAQTEPQQDPDEEIQQEQAQETATKESEESYGSPSLIDGILQNSRNRMGFTLGAYEAYTNNIYPSGADRKASTFTAIAPNIFMNFGRRRTKFHLDFGGGYRFYQGHSDSNGYDFRGSATFSRQLTRRTSFQISDQANSSQDVYGAYSVPIYSPLQYGTFFDQIRSIRRVTSNDLLGRYEYSGRSISWSFFGGLQSYKYEENELLDGNAVQIGANFDYRITKWLSLTNSYTTYLGNPNPLYADTRIHRLEAGGLRFNLTKRWVLSGGGGVELAYYQNHDYVRESARVSLGYESGRSKLEMSYLRGFYSVFGLQGLFYSDSVNLSTAHRITDRMALKLAANYSSASEIVGSAQIENLSGAGALEFVLLRGLIASVNYSYQHQRSENYIYYYPGLSRYVAALGLQYVFPNRGPNR
jgi:hypothetical protein